MGNEPTLALPEGADDFIVYYDARSKELEACSDKERRPHLERCNDLAIKEAYTTTYSIHPGADTMLCGFKVMEVVEGSHLGEVVTTKDNIGILVGGNVPTYLGSRPKYKFQLFSFSILYIDTMCCDDIHSCLRLAFPPWRGVTEGDLADKESESYVEEDDQKTASFLASKSSKGTSSSKSGGGMGRKSLYEHWKDDYDDNPYDEEEEHEDLSKHQLAICNAFDLSLRGQIRC
ncbi:hypothetical protein Tco_0305263 [Tanacetum coccineum]